ncbi:MAG: AAA family ATPase [Eubacteriales bacterium]
MAKIISFSNQKGGVGKTTSCVNIAAELGKLGKRVLLVDIDPQGNATTGLGIAKKHVKTSVYEVLVSQTPPQQAILETPYRNLHILPATIALAGAELDLHDLLARQDNPLLCLREPSLPYDFILIDCPPSLGLLTVAALSASDGVVIPMQCEFFALEGLSQLLMTIKRVRKTYNPALEITGILLTMYNARLTLTRQVVEELNKYYADKLFRTPVSRSVKLSEASGYGEPICYLAPASTCAEEYHAVTKELLLLV